MKIDSLINQKEKDLQLNGFIQFTDEEIDNLKKQEVERIIACFHGRALMQFPPAEIAFFEWLKLNDNPVWNDIWEGDENLYKVSVDFLGYFLKEKNGFPICDLAIPNYYFTVKHIKPQGMAHMQAIVDKTERGEQLNLDELLLFELHIAAIDIWHFAYRYKLKLADVKELISEMDYKGWIVHLTDRDDLLKYVEE